LVAEATSQNRRRRVAPAVGLYSLAPLVGEYLLGNVSIAEIWAPPILAPPVRQRRDPHPGGGVPHRADLLSFVVGHACWSIAVPIVMVEPSSPSASGLTAGRRRSGHASSGA
jgi:hypothetical protein